MVVAEAATVAAINLLGKVSYDVWKHWFNGGAETTAGVALDTGGGYHGLQHPADGLVYLTDPEFFGWEETEPAEMIGYFVPVDQQAAQWLEPDQPVLVAILDTDPASDLEGLIIPTYLDEPFEAALYPGLYILVAFVFLDDDVDELDGIAISEFTVDWDDVVFTLEIPVADADELEIEELLDDLFV